MEEPPIADAAVVADIQMEEHESDEGDDLVADECLDLSKKKPQVQKPNLHTYSS